VHLASLRRLATRLTGSLESAEDVTQDALLRILRGWKGFRGQSAFKTWATCILLNVFHDWLSKQHESLPLSDVSDLRQADPMSCAMAEELGRHIAQRVSALPPRQREVLVLLAKLVQPLLAERAECEQRLLERFRTLDDERASVAIELLGCVGSEVSVPFILQASINPATHAQAVRAPLKIADTRMLARLALNESDPDLRDEITAALRVLGDKQTLVFVLAVQGEYSCLVPRPD
jgi:RNA polymerase sigma factor (sigma-70 family)